MPRRRAFRRVFTAGQLKGSKTITGLTPLVAKLNALGDAVEADEVYRVLLEGAEVVRDEIKGRVPYGSRHRDDRQGPHIRDLVFSAEGDPSRDRRGPNVLAGVGSRKLKPTNRAVLLERGTSRTRAQPFFRPGIKASRGSAYEIIKRGLAQVITAASLGRYGTFS